MVGKPNHATAPEVVHVRSMGLRPSYSFFMERAAGIKLYYCWIVSKGTRENYICAWLLMPREDLYCGCSFFFCFVLFIARATMDSTTNAPLKWTPWSRSEDLGS